VQSRLQTLLSSGEEIKVWEHQATALHKILGVPYETIALARANMKHLKQLHKDKEPID
jgi:hypothetical protein